MTYYTIISHNMIRRSFFEATRTPVARARDHRSPYPTIWREFKDVMFEDVVFDNNRFEIDVTINTIDDRVTKLLLSNTTSSNTTSLNSRICKICEQNNTRVRTHTIRVGLTGS